MSSKTYTISQLELDALKYLYYCALYGLDNSKGLAYKQCFQFKKSLNKTINDLIVHNINVNDYIIVEVMNNDNK